MHKNENTQNSHSFLALAFFRGICLSRHQQIWIQHKILRFFDTHIDTFPKKNFWVIIALFAILKCKCEKNCTFSNILQKVKSYFLPISTILRVIPIKFETLKPPTKYPLTKILLVVTKLCAETKLGDLTVLYWQHSFVSWKNQQSDGLQCSQGCYLYLLSKEIQINNACKWENNI